MSPFYAFLSAADRLAEARAFRPFDRWVRRASLGVLAPAVQGVLRASASEAGLALLPRHSVLNSQAFRALRSDLDFTIVLPELKRLPAAYRTYRRLRKLVWSLGELEVYTPAEMSVWDELRLRQGDLLAAFREIRKCRWQHEALRLARSEYHRRKAQNSLARAEREAASLESRLLRLFPEVDTGAEFDAEVTPVELDSLFLGWTVSNRAGRGPLRLTLAHRPLLLLLSLMPDANVAGGRVHERVRGLRARYPRLRDAYVAVAASEMLLCRSSARTSAFTPAGADPTIAHWLEYLDGEIREYCPELADALAAAEPVGSEARARAGHREAESGSGPRNS